MGIFDGGPEAEDSSSETSSLEAFLVFLFAADGCRVELFALVSFFGFFIVTLLGGRIGGEAELEFLFPQWPGSG